MSIGKEYLKQFIKSTELAACGAYPLIGKNDKIAADQGAVDKMREQLNLIDMDGTVVIGEGEMDEAPMLYIGEKVGTKNGLSLDIALDPLEGTNFVAKNLPNAISVLAVTEKGNLLSAPDTYMEKMAIGSNLPKNLLNLDNSIKKNISLLSDAKNTVPEKITACILDRPRHSKIIQELKSLKVKINFIPDGDVYGAIAVIDENSPVDIYLGIGGGPEGVLAAAALSCFNAQMQSRLVLDKEESKRAVKLGIRDIKKQYSIDEMVKGDVIFCATGITDGELVKGVRSNNDAFTVETFALHKSSRFNQKVTNIIKK
jgi:fructose-1,6-bisphosphatase II / sedoheptulose-1,7-bisphosphatase